MKSPRDECRRDDEQQNLRYELSEEMFLCPASFAQQRLWFVEQLSPGSGVYNIARAYRLHGDLDIGALERSINQIVTRHEGLRTLFEAHDGTPAQVILSSLELPLAVDDLGHLSTKEREAAIQMSITAEATLPFDLERGPLLRVQLLRLGSEEHVLLLTIHHIISDGWSMGVLMRELSALYRALVAGQSSPLEALPIQYADYAVWQREWLQGEELSRQLGYWQAQLEELAPLQLPTDRPRPAEQSFRGAHVCFRLPQALTESLKSLNHREDVTLFMTLLAAFQLLLSRYSGQDDIAVGSPIAGRNRAETEGLIGFFINTLVLRTDLSGDPTFKELLERVREVCLDAYDHQDLPFEKLVEELAPERDLNRNPFFDVMINLYSGVKGELDLFNVSVEPIAVEELLSKFTMTLYIVQEHDGIDLQLVYQRDLLSQESMRCVIEQYCYLLEQIVESTEWRISNYSLVTPQARHLLQNPKIVLEEPQYSPVTRLFGHYVLEAGECTALCQGARRWSYNELSHAVDQLVAVLGKSGVEKGIVVALSGPRSFGFVVGMLAVMSSGAVVLPIDPILPGPRKQLMLREAGAELVLRVEEQGARRTNDGWETGSPVISIDAASGIVEQRVSEQGPVLLPSRPATLQNGAAYIFFTSGSTGVPKGVLGCHKSLSHFLDWQRSTFAVGTGDRVAQLTSMSFDVILRDIFLPLTSGGVLCLPEEEDMSNIPDWLERENITVLHTVPAVLQSWLDQPGRNVSLRALRLLFVAGEPLNGVLVEKWRRVYPGSGEIVNLYGATETTLVKSFHRLGMEVNPGIQPIGVPISHTQLLVLRKGKHLCGPGELGEIAIRTPFMTLGYINDPRGNKSRFVTNPYRSANDDLLYLTGDQGRFRPDGILEVHGRIDNQVKIRGVRVEPEEVTSILLQHEYVKEGVVAGRKNVQGQYCLVAYIVLDDIADTSALDIQHYLGQFLPGAMVPGAIVFMDRLPILHSGKIDMSALPGPNQQPVDSRQTYVEPRTPIERVISGIWSDVLSVAPIGIHDNFFELGGHSLLATQVMARIRDVLQVNLPLRDMFDSPTVEAMAKSVLVVANVHDEGNI